MEKYLEAMYAAGDSRSVEYTKADGVPNRSEDMMENLCVEFGRRM